MKIQVFGALLIGGILFTTGVAVLASNLDPSVLCFRRCDIQRLVIETLGRDVARALTGTSLAGIGALFVLPALRSVGKRRN